MSDWLKMPQNGPVLGCSIHEPVCCMCILRTGVIQWLIQAIFWWIMISVMHLMEVKAKTFNGKGECWIFHTMICSLMAHSAILPLIILVHLRKDCLSLWSASMDLVRPLVVKSIWLLSKGGPLSFYATFVFLLMYNGQEHFPHHGQLTEDAEGIDRTWDLPLAAVQAIE